MKNFDENRLVLGPPSSLTDVGAKLLNFFFQKVQSSGTQRVKNISAEYYGHRPSTCDFIGFLSRHTIKLH